MRARSRKNAASSASQAAGVAGVAEDEQVELAGNSGGGEVAMERLEGGHDAGGRLVVGGHQQGGAAPRRRRGGGVEAATAAERTETKPAMALVSASAIQANSETKRARMA